MSNLFSIRLEGGFFAVRLPSRLDFTKSTLSMTHVLFITAMGTIYLLENSQFNHVLNHLMDSKSCTNSFGDYIMREFETVVQSSFPEVTVFHIDRIRGIQLIDANQGIPSPDTINNVEQEIKIDFLYPQGKTVNLFALDAGELIGML